jgi:hypothetical protein
MIVPGAAGLEKPSAEDTPAAVARAQEVAPATAEMEGIAEREENADAAFEKKEEIGRTSTSDGVTRD